MGTPLYVFEQHIETIKQLGFEIVQQITNDKKQIMLCFDDGFHGIWDNKEFFIDNNIMPTIFIAVDLVGKPGYLSVDEIKTLSSYGFRFQAHGWTHTNLAKFNDSDLEHELYEAKKLLASLTGLEITEICFPQGYYSNKVVKAAQKYGYKVMYTSDPKPYAKRIAPYLLPRYLVQYANNSQLKAVLQGGMDCLYNHYYRLHKQ